MKGEKIVNGVLIRKVESKFERVSAEEMTARINKLEIINGILMTTLETVLDGGSYDMILNSAKQARKSIIDLSAN